MSEPLEILLSPLEASDIQGVHSLWSDASATLYTNFPHIPNIDQSREHLAKVFNFYAKNSLHFGPYKIHLNNGTFLGLCGGDIADENEQKYEIWYFIHRAFWGKKIATAAVNELLRVMSESRRVKVLKAEAVVDNTASWKFLERLGFERTEYRQADHKKEGRVFDRYVYTKHVIT